MHKKSILISRQTLGRIIGTLLFFTLACTYSLAQQDCKVCEKIKRDKSYYWSFGIGNTYNEALSDAKSILSGNISQMVQSLISDSITYEDRNGKIDASQSINSIVKGYSNVILNDLTVIELSPEPECKLFVYVEKSKVRDIFDERRNQILDFVESGKYAEQDLQIDDALRFYYWALMLAQTLPQSVEVSIGGRSGNAISLLPVKIRSVLGAISCSMVSCEENDYGENVAMFQFNYNGNPVSSLRFKYFNGQSFAGPVYVKDGRGEVVLLDMPPDDKMKINYEYRFQEEAKQILPDIFENTKAVIINESQQDCLVKADKSKKKAKTKQTTVATPAVGIRPEPTETVETLAKTTATTPSDYSSAMAAITEAIRKQKPEMARQYMTPECHKLFDQLITKTGKVGLTAQKNELEYVEAEGQVLARFLYVTIKFNSGKTFMDKLVFRFSPRDKLVHSFAFGLTEKAENDIFDAAKSWSSVSRYTILGFMEDYQTAYALKRMDYIESIFSENAIIVIGNELQPMKEKNSDKIKGQMDCDRRVKYNKMTKQEYLNHLKQIFKTNNYVHLSFEDNTTRTVNTGGVLPEGSAFAIQIKQIYSSSRYSDRGYLTLMLNMNGEHPSIVVRYWQPDKEPIVDMGEFFSSKNISW